MAYEIYILEPAREFLDTLNVKLKAKTYRTLDLLEQFGPYLREPHSKKVTGIADLYELRIKQGSVICRLFYFHHKDKIYVVTSGYIKKDTKLKKAEINKAMEIMKIYREDYKNE